eukprot:1050290-Prymnesium_polylepis.1
MAGQLTPPPQRHRSHALSRPCSNGHAQTPSQAPTLTPMLERPRSNGTAQRPTRKRPRSNDPNSKQENDA